MDGAPEIVQQVIDHAIQVWDMARGGLLNPDAWSQFALVPEAAVAALDSVMTAPDAPDGEIKGVADSGREFGVEYWGEGIENPYPQQVVRNKGLNAIS